jgi:hypothetical protein
VPRHQVAIGCACRSADHVMCVVLESGDGFEPVVYVQPMLDTNKSFFGRLGAALRYVLRRPVEQSWCFDTIIMRPEGVASLLRLLTWYDRAHRLHTKMHNKSLHKE